MTLSNPQLQSACGNLQKNQRPSSQSKAIKLGDNTAAHEHFVEYKVPHHYEGHSRAYQGKGYR